MSLSDRDYMQGGSRRKTPSPPPWHARLLFWLWCLGRRFRPGAKTGRR